MLRPVHKHVIKSLKPDRKKFSSPQQFKIYSNQNSLKQEISLKKDIRLSDRVFDMSNMRISKEIAKKKMGDVHHGW